MRERWGSRLDCETGLPKISVSRLKDCCLNWAGLRFAEATKFCKKIVCLGFRNVSEVGHIMLCGNRLRAFNLLLERIAVVTSQ